MADRGHGGRGHQNNSSVIDPALRAHNSNYEQYPWMKPVQWMHQLQPIPPEQLPRSNASMEYEGYVPGSGQHESQPSRERSTHTYPWPAEDRSLFMQTSDPQEIHMNQVQEPFSEFEDTDNISYDDEGELQPSTRGRRKTTQSKLSFQAQQFIRPLSKQKEGAGRRRGERRGPRDVIDPGEAFHALHAEATEAFLDGAIDKAHRLILSAIAQNPEIFSAHVLLSRIHLARGDHFAAIQCLFTGTHSATNDSELWHQAAGEVLQISTGDRLLDLELASYCYSRVLQIDGKDTEARYQQAMVSRERGHLQKALSNAEKILYYLPHDSRSLQLIAEISIEMNQPQVAAKWYEEKLLQHQSGTLGDGGEFTWADLLIFVEVTKHVDGVANAIKTLKDIARWLVGRSAEVYWTDLLDDDREWDASSNPRRLEVPLFQQGLFPNESYGAALPLELRVKLGELRLAEGKRSEALDHYDWLDPEAREEGASVYEYPDLFLQIADALAEEKEFRQGFRYYRALYEIQAYDDLDFWLGIGACAAHCGNKNDALTYYMNAISTDPNNAEAQTQLAHLYIERHDRPNAIKHSRQALELYQRIIPRSGKRYYERREVRLGRLEAQNIYKKAYKLTPAPGEDVRAPVPSFSRRAQEKARRKLREVQDAEDSEGSDYSPEETTSVSVSQLRRKHHMRRPQRNKEEQERSIADEYDALCRQTEAMRNGDEEARSLWIEHAETLIEEFRSEKRFYPSERYKIFQGFDRKRFERKNFDTDVISPADEADVPFPSIEPDIPEGYCGISFLAWLDVFLEYALLIANMQYDASEVYTVINAAQGCTIWYHDLQAMTQIYLCYLACGLALEDELTVFNEVMRWFMREYAYLSDAYRLFSAINFYYPHSPDKGGKLGQTTKSAFRFAPTQKFVFRHVAYRDTRLPPGYGRNTRYGSVPEAMRRGRGDHRMTEKDPEILQATASSDQNGDLGADGHVADSQELDIALLMVYGQILYASGSYHSAMSYFYRALSLDPKNPPLLLTLALSYLHEIFKRTNETRHQYFLQGWAYFEEYAEARLDWAANREATSDKCNGLVQSVRREVEFNRARCWQMNGLADTAIRGYRQILDTKQIKAEESEEDAMDMDVDSSQKNQGMYDMESAYSLALIYATNGDNSTARDITERWLVVD